MKRKINSEYFDEYPDEELIIYLTKTPELKKILEKKISENEENKKYINIKKYKMGLKS